MFSELLRADRERSGLTSSKRHGAWESLRSPTAKLEAAERWPSWETYDQVAAAFGWPRSFR